MNNDWQPIETAPKDGRLVLCWRDGWEDEGVQLRWKHNNRLDPDRAGMGERSSLLAKYVPDYFGDPDEWDDYNFALKDGSRAPTHWLPQPPPPSPRKSVDDTVAKLD